MFGSSKMVRGSVPLAGMHLSALAFLVLVCLNRLDKILVVNKVGHGREVFVDRDFSDLFRIVVC